MVRLNSNQDSVVSLYWTGHSYILLKASVDTDLLQRNNSFMKRIGMKEPGKYERANQHGGKMFALPNEVSLSGLQAGKLLRKCY